MNRRHALSLCYSLLGFFGLASISVTRLGADPTHDIMVDDWPQSSVSVQFGPSASSGWIEDDFVYGVRTGFSLYRLGFEFTYERTDSTLISSRFPGLGGRDVDATMEFYDFSIGGYFMVGREKMHKLLLYGGPGFASLDVEAWPAGLAGNPEDDFFTLHLGVGSRFFFSDHFYFRPDLTARWIEEKDEVRMAFTMGVGYGTRHKRPSSKKSPRCTALRWEFHEVAPQAEKLAERTADATAQRRASEREIVPLYELAVACLHDMRQWRDHYSKRCESRGDVSNEEISRVISKLEEATGSLESFATKNEIPLPDSDDVEE